MDYREREYFLINIKSDHRNEKIFLMKHIAPSLKLSAPEKHYKNGKYHDSDNLKDILWTYNTHVIAGICSPTHLVSVRKEEVYYFMIFLKLMSQGDVLFYRRLSKEELGQ